MKLKKIEIKFDKNDFKSTITSLNNIFMGSMLITAIALVVWLWKVFNIWLFIIPISYVAMCYIGKFIRLQFFSHVQELSDKSDNETKEEYHATYDY